MADFTSHIKKIVQETHDVRSFMLDKPRGFHYLPGEYAFVSIPGDDEKRPFTFSSAPEDPFLRLTIKEMHDVTVKMFGLKQGDRLDVSGPQASSLSLNDSYRDDIVLLAGGSGITPFISMIRHADFQKLPNRMTLFYANRTMEDIIYRSELTDLKSRMKNLATIYTLSDEPSLSWKGELGRISHEMILRYIKPVPNQLWYVCGPPGMVLAMRQIILGLGIKEDMIRIEDWQLPGKSG